MKSDYAILVTAIARTLHGHRYGDNGTLVTWDEVTTEAAAIAELFEASTDTHADWTNYSGGVPTLINETVYRLKEPA